MTRVARAKTGYPLQEPTSRDLPGYDGRDSKESERVWGGTATTVTTQASVQHGPSCLVYSDLHRPLTHLQQHRWGWMLNQVDPVGWKKTGLWYQIVAGSIRNNEWNILLLSWHKTGEVNRGKLLQFCTEFQFNSYLINKKCTVQWFPIHYCN